jgi:medium-chain acyl-[acyl-carrier-protein] hydrolase
VLNGTPPQIFENIELLTFLLPCIRADFKVLETYRYQPGAALELSATIFSGAQDPETPKDDIRAWVSCLSGEISFHEYDGDHFFLLNQDSLVSILHQIVVTAKSLSPTQA